MRKEKNYAIKKNKLSNQAFAISTTKINGYEVKPKNQVQYEGIQVNSLLMVKPTFIEKVLKKKNKRKIEYYLNYIIELLDEEDSEETPTNLRQALNDLARYRDIIKYKYCKYLDDKYVELLLKKIDLLEHQLKAKLVYYTYTMPAYEQEETKGKSR